MSSIPVAPSRRTTAVPALARLQAAWGRLATRERTLVGTALTVVVLALLWWVGIAPALTTLRTADAQHRVLDAQLQSMRTLAAEAASLQSVPRIQPAESRRALDLSVKQRLGATAQIAVLGDRATVTLKDVPPDALVQWLAQVRTNARASVSDARLTLNAARTGWDGSVVLALPSP